MSKRELTDLYRQRREKAAAIWRAVRPEQFDMGHWIGPAACGTSACALGWLGALRHDGWVMEEVDRFWPTWGGEESSFLSASMYFGLSLGDSFGLFLHGVDRSADEVADALLALPYDPHLVVVEKVPASTAA